MFILVLNSTNIVNDGENNKLVYKFPNSVNLKDKYVSVSNVSMYYSWFNITDVFQNNIFYYNWTVGTTVTTYTVTLPNGAYNISTINDAFQYACVSNGTYWISSTTGEYAYPAEFILDLSRYAVQINTYLLSAAVPPTGYYTPSNFPGWGDKIQNIVITIPKNLNKILGFSINFKTDANLANLQTIVTTPYVSKNSLGTISYLSTTAPNVQPNNNVLFSMSGINNPYSQPSSIIYSLNPSVSFGELITVSPPNFIWNKIIDGTYNELRLTLLGTNLQPLVINDSNMTILLTIRDKDEISGK